MSMRAPSPEWHQFATPGGLAQALAARVAEELRAAVDARGAALLAVSGGSTPTRFFAALSQEVLPWEQVTVMLVDERFVPPSSDRLNEKLARKNLLRNEAAIAKFVGLYSGAATVEKAAGTADERLAKLPFPIDVAVLGMGLDGHTASFFPDAGNLAELLDPSREEAVLPVHAPGAGEPRLTLPLARLVESGFIALHIEGSAKQELLLSVLREAAGDAPVRHVFRHSKHPVQIYWAPNEDEAS